MCTTKTYSTRFHPKQYSGRISVRFCFFVFLHSIWFTSTACTNSYGDKPVNICITCSKFCSHKKYHTRVHRRLPITAIAVIFGRRRLFVQCAFIFFSSLHGRRVSSCVSEKKKKKTIFFFYRSSPRANRSISFEIVSLAISAVTYILFVFFFFLLVLVPRNISAASKVFAVRPITAAVSFFGVMFEPCLEDEDVATYFPLYFLFLHRFVSDGVQWFSSRFLCCRLIGVNRRNRP